jgi:hypothetical protein
MRDLYSGPAKETAEVMASGSFRRKIFRIGWRDPRRFKQCN